MSWFGVDLLALAKLSQTIVPYFLPAFVLRISCVTILVCSMHPENLETPPILTEILIQALSVRNDVSLLAKTAKNIFPSTFNNDMVQNYLTVLELISFGLNIPSASFQASGTSPFLSCYLCMVWCWVQALSQILPS